MNKLTKKVIIGCAVLLTAAIVIFLIALASPDTNADSYLQYAGTIIGGFATMTAVVVALLDRDQDRAIENKPRISLGLKEAETAVNTNFEFFRWFDRKSKEEKAPGLTLVLENKGSTEVWIKGIYVGVEQLGSKKTDPYVWLPYRNYSLTTESGNKLNMLSDCIDIGSSLALPLSVSEKRYDADGVEQTTAADLNRYIVEVYFTNEFYSSTLFMKQYQIDQPLRSSANWWRSADIRLVKTAEIEKTMETVAKEKEAVLFSNYKPK